MGKRWGSQSLDGGHPIALNGEAGYQADLLRGGIHFGLWRWQYRIHKVPLVTIPQGKIGYVYARDGEPLPPSQTLGRVVDCNNFQDARTFLGESRYDRARRGRVRPVRGQRGRPARAILREGVYAINPALFVVITEDAVYRLQPAGRARNCEVVVSWQQAAPRGRRLQPRRGRRADDSARSAPARRANQRRQHRHRHRSRRPVAGARRDHRPGRRQPRQTIRTITTTTRTPRRSCAPAAAAAGSTCR